MLKHEDGGLNAAGVRHAVARCRSAQPTQVTAPARCRLCPFMISNKPQPDMQHAQRAMTGAPCWKVGPGRNLTGCCMQSRLCPSRQSCLPVQLATLQAAYCPAHGTAGQQQGPAQPLGSSCRQCQVPVHARQPCPCCWVAVSVAWTGRLCSSCCCGAACCCCLRVAFAPGPAGLCCAAASAGLMMPPARPAWAADSCSAGGGAAVPAALRRAASCWPASRPCWASTCYCLTCELLRRRGHHRWRREAGHCLRLCPHALSSSLRQLQRLRCSSCALAVEVMPCYPRLLLRKGAPMAAIAHGGLLLRRTVRAAQASSSSQLLQLLAALQQAWQLHWRQRQWWRPRKTRLAEPCRQQPT